MSKMGVGRCCCGKFVYVTTSSSSQYTKPIGLDDTSWVYVDDPSGSSFGYLKVAIDYKHSEVYLSKSLTSLYSVTHDYKSPVLLYTQPSGYSIQAQCVDYVSRRVYFITVGGGDTKIWRIDHDGGNITDLYTCSVFSGFQKWTAAHVACRPEENKIFWIEYALNTATAQYEYRIRSADLDAAGPTDLLYFSGAYTEQLYDLVADHENNRIWFTSQKHLPASPFNESPKIQYCNLDGTGQTTWKTAIDANAINHQFININVSRLDGRVHYAVWTYFGAVMDAGDGWYSDTFAQDDLTFISDSAAGGVQSQNSDIDLGKGYERFG